MRFIKLTLLIVIIAFVAYVAIGSQVYWREYDETAEPIVFVVEGGSSLGQVAENLKEADVIDSVFFFKAYAKWQGLSASVQAGEFVLYPGMSIEDTLASLTRAEEAERSVTILEGWSVREIDGYLVEQGISEQWELYELTGGPAEVAGEAKYVTTLRDEYAFLESKPTEVGLDGYLFPDTYRIFIDATLDEIVHKMLDNFNVKLTEELRTEIARQGKTIHEIITMASIIEREVRGEEDRKLVSDIFWKRYNVGMPLQADSTVNYVTGKDTPAISFEDRDIDDLYNTYQYPGLPPGPIANPSLEAIEAAIYPISNDHWYFLTDQDGNVHYASTNDEHANNKALYLR